MLLGGRLILSVAGNNPATLPSCGNVCCNKRRQLKLFSKTNQWKPIMIMENMTTDEVQQHLQKCRSVIIPYGVMEAHGPHMPLSTDTIQAVDAAVGASEIHPVFVAASVNYGMCRSASGHAGTIGISGSTLRALTYDIIHSLYKSGIRNFILFSGHASGKQLASMEEASEKFIDAFDDANIAVVCDYDITKKADFIETPGDIHAGEIETSRIMAIEPSLVKVDKFPPAETRQFPKPILVRDQKRYWPGTVEGDPATSTAEKGEKLRQMVAQYLADLVVKMESFEPH